MGQDEELDYAASGSEADCDFEWGDDSGSRDVWGFSCWGAGEAGAGG